MTSLLGAVVIALTPFLAVAGLLLLSTYRERRAQQVLARQLAVTEAIHRELGAVAAPVVRKPAWGPWQLRLALPLDRPALAARILAIAHAVLAGGERRPWPLQIVLVPAERR